MKGLKLPSNVIPIAAINPYRLKSDKQKKMTRIQIHGGIKKELISRIENTDLEYTVEPLPESMYSFVWNFDNLAKKDEKSYIFLMVEQKAQKCIEKHEFSKKDQFIIANTILKCQMRLRYEMGYSSACSLRDVNRFLRLLFWFVKFIRICQQNGFSTSDNSKLYYILAFYIVYCVRLPLLSQREDFAKMCALSLDISLKIFNESINDMEVPRGIVKNTALKQNIFTLMVSILKKIPVVLIGPPGSSKTISMRIIIETMKGKQSKSPFFKNFPALWPLFYQGHIQSTSKRILEVFENAKLKQQRFITEGQAQNYLSLVYIEEIGLAEISPHNPLKVLHETLENPSVSVACVSNWPLDQSKMNRMISIYRLNTNEHELFDTIKCIEKDWADNQEKILCQKNMIVLNDDIIMSICKVYINYLREFKEQFPQYEQFHGLRDFYGMAKILCLKHLEPKQNISEDILSNGKQRSIQSDILYSFLRHFSGLNEGRTILISCLVNAFPSIPDKVNNIDIYLINQNLIENYHNFTSRNLMLISNNVQSAINYISNKLVLLNKPFKIFIGSDFYQDLKTESSIEILNQIISCIENGRIVIITNLDNIYQSLYDLLNQNYRHAQGKTFCKISFGSESNNVEVHPKFKIILIIHHSSIHRMDGPLINRFEKHTFEESMIMNISDSTRTKDIVAYFSKPGLEHLFLFDNLEEMVRSLIIQQNMLKEQDDLDNERLIQTLYHLSSLSETLQYCDSQDRLQKEAMVSSQYHFSFQDFIANRILKSPKLPSKYQLFTIFSPSIFFKQESCYIQKIIHLSMLDSSRLLEDQMTDFFQGRITNDFEECFISDVTQSVQRRNPHIMVIISDQNEKLEKINYVRNKIVEQFVINKSPSNCFVIMVVRTPEKFSMLPFICQWEQYYIEDLFPLRSQMRTQNIEFFNLKKIFQYLEFPVLKIIEFKQIISEFLKKNENVTASFKLLKYKEVSEGYSLARLKQLQKIFTFDEITHLSFKKIATNIIFERTRIHLESLGIISTNDFFVKYIIGRGFSKSISSLHSAVWRGVHEIIQYSFALLISSMEHSSLVYSLSMNDVVEIDSIAIEKLCRFTEQQECNEDNQQELIIQSLSNDKNSLIIDNNSKDLLYPDSLTIFRSIQDFVSNISISKKDDELEQSMQTVYEKTMLLLTESQMTNFKYFQENILIDFEKLGMEGTEPFQRKIQKQIIRYIDQGQIPQIIVIIMSLNWFKDDIYKFMRLLTNFEWLEDTDTLLQVNKNKQRKGYCVINFGIDITIKLFERMKPTPELIQKMRAKSVNYGQMASVLISFVDTFDLQEDNDIQQIKYKLMCYSALDITYSNERNLSENKVNFMDKLCLDKIGVESFQILTKNLRDMYTPQLNGEQLIQIEQRIFSLGLDIYSSQLKAKRNTSFQDLICHALPFLLWIEQESMRVNKSLSSQLVVKYNIILNNIVTRITSLQEMVEIFSLKNFNTISVVNDPTLSIESATLVILTDIFQKVIFQNIFISNPHLTIIADLICFNKIKKLTVFQQSIYLSIFREATTYALHAHFLQFPQLKQLFESNVEHPLKIYIVKRLLSECKEKESLIQFCNKSPYFKEAKWIILFTDYNNLFFNSQSSDESKAKLFYNVFADSNQSFKEKLVNYMKHDLPEAFNVFKELQNGSIYDNQLYPFMLINNIFIFHEGKEQNNQLYQCLNCLEFIFSNNCSHLQSQHPCMRCGKQIAANNGNTKQVLTNVNSNLQRLQQEEKNNVWRGIYLRLEEDQIHYKLNEGTSLDLRIFTLLYAQCLLLASQKQSFPYNQYIDIEIFNPKININIKPDQKEVRKMRKINQIMKIYYEADYISYLQEQIDFSISHINKIMEIVYNKSEKQKEIIIFQMMYNLIRNPLVQKSQSPQQRDKINIQLSQNIQESLSLITQLPLQSLEIMQFQKTLRIVNSNITADFAQTLLRQLIPKNEYQALQELLNISKLQQMHNQLRVLIQFYTLVNKNLSQKFTKKKSQEINLYQALQQYPNDFLLKFYTNEVIPAWENIKKTYIMYTNGCQDTPIESLSVKTKLNHLIFSNKTFGYFSNVLELLCDTHNNFIKRIHQLLSMENNSSQFLLVEKSLSMIDYDLNIVRPYDKNILTLYVLNDIQNSINPKYIFDLNLLEKELIKIVLSGTCLINLADIKQFSFQADINHIGLLSNFMIPQELISQNALDRLLQSLKEKEEAFDFLSCMSQIFSYYKAEKNHLNISLKAALISLQIATPPGQLSDLLEGELKLSHVTQVIRCLEEYLMDSLVELCNPYYKMTLDKSQAQSTIQFVSKCMPINHFRLALGRFIIRGLSQEHNQIDQRQKLFEQIFESSVYEELWNDVSIIDDIYKQACQNSCLIAHSFSLYTQVNNSINYSINHKTHHNKSTTENKISNNDSMYMDSFTDSNFTTSLKNQVQKPY